MKKQKVRHIEYTIRKHRQTKRMKLTVSVDGQVSVTIPYWTPFERAQEFFDQQFEWVLEKLEEMKKKRKGGLFFRPNSEKEFQQLKHVAYALVMRRIERLNELYGFSYKSITIRNQRTRWGSCSTNGNLSFNYRILFLSPRQADYIIVHELCHLREFNHSQRFWNLVEKTIPEYKKIIQVLRNY